MRMSEGASLASSVTIAKAPGGAASVSISGTPEVEEDTGLLYNYDCQLVTQLCYLIKFEGTGNISPTTFKVTVKGIKNPESIYPAGKLIITTMMKYGGET